MERRLLLADFTVTNTFDSGDGSLRAAIDAANITPGPHTINFNIESGPQTIAPLTFYPPLIEAVVIDGTTQPGFAGTPLITIDGINLPGSTGLRLSGGNSTVRGLHITRFGNNALALDTAGGNVVEGNHLLGNGGDGVQVNSGDNRIGGTDPAQRNVIGGNGDSGIDITGAGGNLVIGNYVGTNASGTAAHPNLNYGVRIADGTSNTIGGTSASERNIISGNSSDGIRITGLSSGNVVRGNWIGLAAGGAALGNGDNGITLFSPNNTIGGTIAAAGNVISANQDHGIHVSGAAAGGNIIQGNLIGTNVSGSAAMGNGQPLAMIAGVRINGASNTLIGGTSGLARNIIAGNNGDGIRIEGAGATGNTIQGNRIGTNAAGTAALPNTNDGVQIRSGANVIGGLQPGAGNLISGNSDDGIDLRNDASGNLIQGNLIGTDVTGTAALGNASDAIEIHGVNTTVGGSSPAARNVLAGNLSDGIEIVADLVGPATGSQIFGNSIGVNINGAPLGNGGHGVHIKGGGATAVGSTTPGAGNTIAHNALDGVYVAASSGHTVRGNSIFANGGLGIDLGADGVTVNDTGDGDVGANDLQNYPLVGSAAAGAGGTLVQFSLNSAPNSSFQIDFYSSASADPSGFGEGASYVGSTSVSTDASGNAAASINVGAVPAGQFITATATTSTGSTSEFCAAVAVSGDVIVPAVLSANFVFTGFTLPAAPHRLVYTFDQPGVESTVDPTDLLLTRNGTPVPQSHFAVTTDSANRTATFTFPGFASGILPDGQYQATLLASGVFNPATGQHLAADHLSQFFFLNGDANRDARVNLADFNILAANFGQSPRSFTQGDFNYDGTVNLADFNILASRFGQMVAPASPDGSPFTGGTSPITAEDGLDDLLA